MATTPNTPFTLDVVGRYVCNTFDEAKASQDESKHPDARPFDMIVLGGGTFGGVLAAHLFGRDKSHAHRILVLEAGRMVFTEHVQNQPMLTTNEVWGVPWNAESPNPRDRYQNDGGGLAFCVGGRSLFWGGWSPYFIDTELPSPPWPAAVKADLTQNVLTIGDKPCSYLDDAARQLGSDTTIDFIQGPLHNVLRDRLFLGLSARPADPTLQLVGNRGTPMTAPQPVDVLKNELEAPLAVQAQGTRPGFFPFNKFSAMQLLIRATRQAQAEAEQAAAGGEAERDVKKRLMVVDAVRAIRLETIDGRVSKVITNQGDIDVPPDGKVFLALGTVENTRLALLTLPNQNGRAGRNLMAHLRSNLTFRARRSAFGSALDTTLHPELAELQVSALFVKGVFQHADLTPGHFHLQITASGSGAMGLDSEGELFKKVPDIDSLDRFHDMHDDWIVVTVRGIGEMVGDKVSAEPRNRVTLDPRPPTDPFDYGTARASVRLDAGDGSSKETSLWEAMDRASEEVALLLAGGDPTQVQYLSKPGGVWLDAPPARAQRHDSLSSTHHEGGTLWMGSSEDAVTDEWGRLHESTNLFALGPCLLPTMGSPNPMLSGVALARRTGDRLVPLPEAPAPDPGFVWLFDGSEHTFNLWKAVGGGAFALVDGNIVAQQSPQGSDLGLLFYTAKNFNDFVLRLQIRLTSVADNSGVFVRSRDPRRPVPRRGAPAILDAYTNAAYVAVDTGFEVQVDELARGNPQRGTPDGEDLRRTGALYEVTIGGAPGQQVYQRGPALVPGTWHDLEVEVSGNQYTVRLDGVTTSRLTNIDAYRGLSASADRFSGYVGLQSHSGKVAFRRIQLRDLAPQAALLPLPQRTARPAPTPRNRY